MSDQQVAQKITPIVFNGKVREYFGIWIVNLLLTLVTFGIYSAWAKVRRKKYFYNNTLIDNVGFDYHGKPIAILKGRLIAFAFLALYSASGGISPILSLALGFVLFLVVPWIVVRSTLFNARNTSHRGLRFDFVGTTSESRKVFMFLPMLIAFTIGLIYPYIAHQKQQFFMNNHRFGLSQFSTKPAVKGFYKAYFFVFFLPILGILAAIAIPAYKGYVDKAKAAQHSELHMPSELAKASLMGFVPFDNDKVILAANETSPETAAIEKIEKIERVYTEETPETAPPEAAPQAAETVKPVAIEPSQQPTNAVPASAEEAAGQQAAEQAQADEMEGEEDAQLATPDTEQTFEEMMKEREEAKAQARRELWKKMRNPAFLGGVLGAFLAYAFIGFGIWGYIKARVGNLVWNNTTLDNLSFKSTLRARDLIAIYFSNIIAIMFTFGLATPWAQIRLAKYRASKLQIIGDVDFDQFVGEKKEELKATGEEIADFFDVDLSFG